LLTLPPMDRPLLTPLLLLVLA
jgi:hypothetical protein